MPILTILAGPNGVGKTRNSDLLVSLNYLPCIPIDIDLLQIQVIDSFAHSIEINLIYFTLNSIQQSKERVSFRVEREKGKFVNTESIIENFEQGLINLDNHYQDFNQVLIIDNSQDNYENFNHALRIQCEINHSSAICYNKNFPHNELQKYLPKLTNFIKQSD